MMTWSGSLNLGYLVVDQDSTSLRSFLFMLVESTGFRQTPGPIKTYRRQDTRNALWRQRSKPHIFASSQDAKITSKRERKYGEKHDETEVSTPCPRSKTNSVLNGFLNSWSGKAMDMCNVLCHLTSWLEKTGKEWEFYTNCTGIVPDDLPCVVCLQMCVCSPVVLK